MPTHVVCLDGTDQTKTQAHPTNIAFTFDSLGGHAADAGNGSYEMRLDGAEPIVGKYLPGVGSQGSSALRVLGNLFGDGIAEPIIRGYTFLSRAWAPGDRIIITGFSRGATAARALGGLVVTQGLLDRTKYDTANKDEAYHRAIAAWYHYRRGRPDLANQARIQWIRRLTGDLPQLGPADFTQPVPVAAIGVFDTVSSLGLPHLDSSGDAVFDFSICDTALNPLVQHGFHALAADETRDLFSPTFWESRPGIVQQIFAGGHSNVGGGYPERGLSDCALNWMLGQLNNVANIFDPHRLGPRFRASALDVARDDAHIFPFTLTPRRARAFPKEALPSDALKERHLKPAETLPGTTHAPYQPKGRYADGSSLFK